MANRLTEDNNTSLDRILYFGDPISAMDFNAKAVMPSFKHRWNNRAHSYYGVLLFRVQFQFMMLKRIHCNLPQMRKMQKILIN